LSLGDDPDLRKGLRGYDGKPTAVEIRNITIEPNAVGGTFEVTFQAGLDAPATPPESEVTARAVLPGSRSWSMRTRRCPSPCSARRRPSRSS
jgi:hypothetical protein